MPAVVEYLDYLGIDHHVPDDLAGQPESLEISPLVHVPDIDQKGVSAVVELDHLHEASLPQITLQVHPQDLTSQNMRSAHHQRLEVIDIVGLLFFQFLDVLQIDQQLLLGEGLLIRALARLSESLEDMGIQ